MQKALIQSNQIEGTRLKDIAPSTFAILFLGTPHRGSKSASIGKVAHQITVVATKRPNLKLLQSLQRNSETLDRLGDSFSQLLLKYNIQIYSYREELETRRFFVFSTVVVEADSAKIGHGREEFGSIPANHSQMTKFNKSSNVGFKRVSAQLRRWIREVKGNRGGMLPKLFPDARSHSVERSGCI